MIEAVTAELFDQRTVFEGKERVMLLSGTAGEGLEPVREMGSTVVHRPLADTDSYDTGDVPMDRTTVIHIVEELVQDFLRDIFLHFFARKHVLREIILHFAFRHIYCGSFMLKCHF